VVFPAAAGKEEDGPRPGDCGNDYSCGERHVSRGHLQEWLTYFFYTDLLSSPAPLAGFRDQQQRIAI
jgi:hypothetical protein